MEDDEGDVPYETVTCAEKMVADYAGLSLAEVENLCYWDFRVLLRDAVIFRASGTERGREYLKKCYLLEQTEPDRKKLRDKFGGVKEE